MDLKYIVVYNRTPKHTQ